MNTKQLSKLGGLNYVSSLLSFSGGFAAVGDAAVSTPLGGCSLSCAVSPPFATVTFASLGMSVPGSFEGSVAPHLALYRSCLALTRSALRASLALRCSVLNGAGVRTKSSKSTSYSTSSAKYMQINMKARKQRSSRVLSRKKRFCRHGSSGRWPDIRVWASLL